MSKSSLGLKNFNPGNLRPGASPWLGQTGVDANGFCIFDTAEHGLRALCKNLLAYQDKHGLNTVRGIISRWAPESENDTAAYIAAVDKALGTGPDAAINLHTLSTLAALCVAIVTHENGQQPYTQATIIAAAATALGVPVPAQSAVLTTPAQPVPLPPAPTVGPVAQPVPSAPSVTKAPLPTRTEELTDVPAADLETVVARFKMGGASVSFSTQPNGLYRVVAKYGSEL